MPAIKAGTKCYIATSWFLKNRFTKDYIKEYSSEGFIEVVVTAQTGSYDYSAEAPCGRTITVTKHALNEEGPV